MSNMVVTALRAYQMKGVSKASGNAYDMCRLVVMFPHTDVSSEKMNLTGFGYEITELEVKGLAAVMEFSRVKFPAQIEIEMGQELDRRGIKSVVYGLKRVIQQFQLVDSATGEIAAPAAPAPSKA